MNSTQASWRKRKLLEMSNFKISSSQGSGMFSPELTKTGTVRCLCTGLSHRRESPSGSHGSHGWTERLCLTDWGPRSCQRWGRPASSTTCLPNHGIHFFEPNFQRLLWKLQMPLRGLFSHVFLCMDSNSPRHAFFYRSVSLTHIHIGISMHAESAWWASHTKNKYSHVSKLFIELILFLKYVNK